MKLSKFEATAVLKYNKLEMLSRNHFVYCFTQIKLQFPGARAVPTPTSLLGPLAWRERHLQTSHCRDQSVPPLHSLGDMHHHSSHSTVCFPTGEEMDSSSGCRDERLQKTTSLKLCRVRAVCNQSLGGPDLLICFKALEFDLRDVILLGSQKKFPGARGEV